MFTDALAMIETAARFVPPDDLRRDPPVPFEVLGDHLAPQSRGARLSVSKLAKRFGETPVLDGIDLNIAPGSFVAIVGKSGCGKSTLLRLILGLETPTSGRIDLPAGAAARFVFQEPRLLPWAKVVDNVSVGLGRTGSRAARRAEAARALADVGLDGRGDAWPSVLSGGQKQRVALARALVSRPRLLALDEPLGALDALTRISMQGLVERVWRDQRFTALLVTHDVSEAIALADRVILVDGGRIALDIDVDLPRPRRRGTPAFAALEKRVLDALFGGFEGGDAI
ncbi:ATP-binding cassette domain-containing protein [Mesorhizobium sp. BR1-1-16]|uniref:ABC transporter ATP-binding protein n=1 Tax=Mesorhizobium sp. BR1-1-16 TaxID=2876653 RepID=UPI001CC9F7D1|nr:ATP-binding cassette domain-containing protein [Mesorhizobium sp. BR1-1-16]MBZ9935982.1 ATP-binding cassette domain-containing protein [Mesorhizobium sp. BR1-1-16]